jgi:hypothetical protein
MILFVIQILNFVLCHLEIDSIEYNDHIFCHKLDNENNKSSFHLML